jgi:hypothetical protein
MVENNTDEKKLLFGSISYETESELEELKGHISTYGEPTICVHLLSEALKKGKSAGVYTEFESNIIELCVGSLFTLVDLLLKQEPVKEDEQVKEKEDECSN